MLDVVRRVAVDLSLSDGQGNIEVEDSLALIDLVGELERQTGLLVPTPALRPDLFSSYERAAQLLEDIAAGRDVVETAQ